MLLLMLLMMREEMDLDEGCLGGSYTDIALPIITRIVITLFRCSYRFLHTAASQRPQRHSRP